MSKPSDDPDRPARVAAGDDEQGTMRRQAMGAGYLLFLAPVDEDGTISTSFLEEAKSAAPRVSKDQPIDVSTARALLLSIVEMGKRLLHRLRDLREVLPVSEDRDARYNDRLPQDAASFIFGAVDNAVKEGLPDLFEALRRAATVTDDELVRDYFERHEGYLAEQKSRLGRRS